MNDDDLEQRLARLRPADVPGELRRRLHAAEPTLYPAGFFAYWRASPGRFLQPWPLAYAGLGAVWVVILTLHGLTRSAPPPVASDYPPLAHSSGSPADPALILTAGFPTGRTLLLTRKNLDSSWP